MLDRFYDYGVIACLDKEGYYTKEGDVYTLKQTATTLKDEDLIKTFKIPGLPDFYTVELTQASAEVNLKKGKTPKVKYSLTGYFKDVNKSITCEGTLKYNYINNVVVDVPQDVRDTWEKYEGYKRDFD